MRLLPRLPRNATGKLCREELLALLEGAGPARSSAVPEAGGDNEAASRAIFDASLDLWQAADNEIGRSDQAAWQEAAQFMRAMGLIEVDVPMDGLFTNQFVDAAPAP